MKNKRLIIENLKIWGELIIRALFSYFIAIIITFIFVDGVLNDAIAELLHNNVPEFYFWCVNNKNTAILLFMIVIFVIMLILYISKKIKELNKMYQSLDYIYNDDTTNIELSSSLSIFSDKLNKIKYEYITNKNKAKEAEQRKNDLIMYMAHDLKTPLTSVIGYLSLLNETDIQDKNSQKKYLKIAYDKALRLEELTNQFFEITRYNLNDMPINKTNIDLSVLFDQLIDEFYPMLEERKLKLQVNKPNSLIYKADGDKLARAFGNLLKNAISYSYEKTIINVDINEMEKIIEIKFQNKGVTIPDYKLNKIFEQFYRADESRETNNGGAGLGLAITKDIIELHNGTIEAKSKDEIIEFIVKLIK